MAEKRRFEGTQEEHRALGIAWHKKHGNMTGFEQEHGVYYDKDGNPRKFRAFTTQGGRTQNYTHQKVSSQKAYQQQRKFDENRFITQLQEAGTALGLPQSSIDAGIQDAQRGNRWIKRFIGNLNKGLTNTQQWSTGHINAINVGGLNVPENQYPQPRGQNSAEGAKQEPNQTSAMMAGAPRDATDYWVRRGIPSSVDPTRGLDPETTQRIIDTNGDRNAIDDILTEYWNSKGKPGLAGATRALSGGTAPASGTTRRKQGGRMIKDTTGGTISTIDTIDPTEWIPKGRVDYADDMGVDAGLPPMPRIPGV